jgi:hypothetical protein
MKTELQTLVDKGIITQAQADQRLQFMQNKPKMDRGMMGGHMGRGRKTNPVAPATTPTP